MEAQNSINSGEMLYYLVVQTIFLGLKMVFFRSRMQKNPAKKYRLLVFYFTSVHLPLLQSAGVGREGYAYNV